MALFDFLFKGSKSEKEKKPESGKTTPGAPAQKPTAPGTAPGAAKIPVAPKPAAAAPRPSGTVKLTPTPRPAAPAKPVSAPQPAKPVTPAPESATKASPEEAAGGDLDSIVSALQQIEQLIADEEGAESKSGRDRNMTPVTLKLAEVAKFAAPLFAPNVQIPADATVEIYIKDLFSQLSRGRVHTSLKQIAQDIPGEFLRPDIEQLEDKEIAVPLPLVVSALDPMELKKRTSSVAKEAKVDNIPTLFTPARPIPTAPPKPQPKPAPPAAARPTAVGATPQKPAAPVEPKPAPPKPAPAPAVEKAEQAQPAVTAKKPPEPVAAPKPSAPMVKAEPTPPVAAPKVEPAVQPKAAPAPAEPVKEVAKPAPPVEPKAPVAVTPAPAAAKPEAAKPVTPVTPPPAPAAAPAAPAQQVAAPSTPTPLKLKKEPAAPAPVQKEPVAPAAAVKAQPVETKPPVVPPAKPLAEKPVAAKATPEAVKPEAKAPAAPAVPAAPAAPPEPKKAAGPAVPAPAAAKVETPPAEPQKPAPTVQPPPAAAAPPPAMAPGKITDMLLGLAKAQPEAPPTVARPVPETPKAVTPTAPPPPPKREVVEPKPTPPPVAPAAAPTAPPMAPRKPVAKEAVAAKPAMPTPVPAIAGTGRVPPLIHRGIDLNTATPEEITARLEGIGRAMAERIVEDRTKNGPFYALYDLARVDGIGARLFERITGWKWHEDLYGQLNVVNQVLDKWDGGLPNLNLVAQRFNAISGFDACVVLHRDGHLLASSWDEKSSQAMEAMGPQIIKRVEQYIKNVCAEDMLSVTVFLHERVLILSQHEDIIFVGIRSPRAFNRRHLQVVQGMAMALGKRFSGLRDAAAEATSPSV